MKVSRFERTERFERELLNAPVDVQEAARQALKRVLENCRAGGLRMHPLIGYPKPTIFKVDVFYNKSWQITFELDGETAVLIRLATHKEIDRRPR